MPKLNILVIDLITKKTESALYPRIMNANFASIMPQVVATWCEQEGHNVNFCVYTGFENLENLTPDRADLVFISAFTHSALKAYAFSNRFRAKGAITVLGGPHARCYPEDAQKYFDYVLGFTNKALIHEVLTDCAQHRPIGIHLFAERQPVELPGVQERWKFIEQTLKKAPIIKIVPMIASMGCPYTCSFCIDAAVSYSPMDYEVIKNDLRFLLTKYKRPIVGWHDPNFGIRFQECMNAIEEAIPPDSIDFIAESSLSLLSEEHLIRMQKNGIKAILPGIESWFDMGNKSKTGQKQGLDKVEIVAEHVNLIQRYIPYIQTNFVLGLDSEEGTESYELTKRFVDKAPGAFPSYSLLNSFGRAATLNLDYQRAGRVLPVPLHFLDSYHAMNVKPLHHSWPAFYDHVIDLTSYTFSKRAIYRRFRANKTFTTKWMNLVRAISTVGYGRWKYHRAFRQELQVNQSFRRFMEGDSTMVPKFFSDRITKDLGADWEWLPKDAIYHDQNAYLNSLSEKPVLTT